MNSGLIMLVAIIYLSKKNKCIFFFVNNDHMSNISYHELTNCAHNINEIN